MIFIDHQIPVFPHTILRKTMKKVKLAVILLIMLVCPIVMGDKQVDVSLSVNNCPPEIYGENLIVTQDSLSIYFSVQDSNTIRDIKTITVIFYEDNKKRTSIRKYSFQGVGTRWRPEPEASFFPPESLSRKKSVQFFLKGRRVLKGTVVVTIVVIDSGQNQTTCVLTAENTWQQ